MLTKQSKLEIVRWIVTEVEKDGTEDKIPSKAVKNFPNYFRGSPSANKMRAQRYWKSRKSSLQNVKASRDPKDPKSVSNVGTEGRKLLLAKAKVGRGRKRAEWVSWLYYKLLHEFERLRTAGLQFTLAVLEHVAINILEDSQHPEFNKSLKDSKGKDVINKICCSWVQGFVDRFGIVCRAQKGKLIVCPEKQEFIERSCVYHLGTSNECSKVVN